MAEVEYIKMPRKDFEKLLKDLTDIINTLIGELNKQKPEVS